MKMENVLRAERDGTVQELHAKAGESLRSTRRSSNSREPMALQARLTITGRVQGVGYRDWAMRPASASASPAGCATAPTAASKR